MYKSVALSNTHKYNDMISHGRKQQISVIFPGTDTRIALARGKRRGDKMVKMIF